MTCPSADRRKAPRVLVGNRLMDAENVVLGDLGARRDELSTAGIGRGTVRKVRQNLGWATGYSALALPVAAGVLEPTLGLVLRPEIAALSMSGSSLTVAVNALLLERLRLPRPVEPPPGASQTGQRPQPRRAEAPQSEATQRKA